MKDFDFPNLANLKFNQLLSYKDIQRHLNENNKLHSSGVYAWFFKISLLGIPDKSQICIRNGFIFVDNWRLRYIGKAEGQSLRERIQRHFNGSSSVSTLRESLGSLLSEELNLYYIRLLSSYKLNDEDKLTKWMKENARVYYFPTDNPTEVEQELLGKYYKDLYLNLSGLPRGEIFKPLRDLRNNLEKIGADKTEKKEIITAYKKNAKEWVE